MYIRRRIKYGQMLADAWPELAVVFVWTLLVIVLYEIAGFTALVVPVLPVTLIGIAVSLYVGFKSTSAYNRWWEARQEMGHIVAASRNWLHLVNCLVFRGSGTTARALREELIIRHLAIIHAMAFQLRQSSRYAEDSNRRMFGSRRSVDREAVLFAEPQVYGRFLSAEEFAAAQCRQNPVVYLLSRQATRLREVTQAGFLDSIRLTAMTDLLTDLQVSYGRCERLKNTPFPRQIAHFGTVFTWIFVILLPLALLEVFEREAMAHNLSTIVTHRYMYTMLPFALVLSWVFLTMEKISDSTEDPFEGGVHDVPVSALCRNVEIDLKQALGYDDIPARLEPVDDVLY